MKKLKDIQDSLCILAAHIGSSKCNDRQVVDYQVIIKNVPRISDKAYIGMPESWRRVRKIPRLFKCTSGYRSIGHSYSDRMLLIV